MPSRRRFWVAARSCAGSVKLPDNCRTPPGRKGVDQGGKTCAALRERERAHVVPVKVQQVEQPDHQVCGEAAGCKAWKSGRPCASRAVSSASKMTSVGVRSISWEAIAGNDDVRSWPLRLSSRTRPRARCIWRRQPSNFTSWDQAGPAGGLDRGTGWHGV